MKRTSNAFTLALGALLASSALAVDLNEQEPNDTFPPNYLTGNPVLTPGTDRFVGSITAGDLDYTYLTIGGTGSAGIWRYAFDVNTGGGDSWAQLFDTTTSGWVISQNDDRSSSDFSSLLRFDHFDTTGSNWNVGLDVEGFSSTDTFSYAVSVSRTLITPTNIGTLNGSASRSVTASNLSQWMQFNVTSAGVLDLATTAGSAVDTQLVLFDANGNTIAANDDAGSTFSALSLSLLPGTYYLAAGLYAMAPDWDEVAGAPVGRNVKGLGSVGAIRADSTFTLNSTFTPVPEPATLVGLGIASLALLRRRKQS